MNYPISIIIPVYKNLEMFYQYLEENRRFFAGCEVIVTNDNPKEDIKADVKKICPEAIVLNNKINLGFAGNVNQGIKKSSRDFVFLMNSDVVLQDDSFKKSIVHFEKNNKLFAVGFAQLEKNDKLVGANYGYFANGLVNHGSKPVMTPKQSKLYYNFWAEGGAAIFRKDFVIKLELFDDLFNPFYWEDIDLSYRAWKSGYVVGFDPSIVVFHRHESTIGKYFDQSKIIRTAFRNQLIFQWKNITDLNLILKHIAKIPWLMLIPGFFDALAKLPQVLKSRKKAVKLFVVSDKEVLRVSKQI